jgi:hypothetical protein
MVMLDTELPCGDGSAQYAWLASDLSTVNRTNTPWLIVGGHRPMYYVTNDSVSGAVSVGPDLTDEFCMGAKDIEPLLQEHEVDLALWGHVHNVSVGV